jgi:Tol biopolymer transport system component
MKNRTRFAVALFALCLLGFALMACEFSVGGGEPSVETAVMARSLDADYEPVETTNVFDPADTFYCSVKVTDLEKDSEVTAKWFFGSELLGEYTYTAEEGGSGHIGFNLSPTGAWLAGNYRVEIYLNDELAQVAAFSVTGAEAPSTTPVVEVPTPTEPVVVVETPTELPPVEETPTRAGIDLGALLGAEGPSFSEPFFAAGVTDDGEPVDVATEFPGDTTIVYAFATYEGVSDGTQYESVWYVDGEEATRSASDWTLGESGTSWIANISKDDGLPSGRYDWELYVEGELVVTEGFVVSKRAAAPLPKPPTTAVLQGTTAFARWDPPTKRYQIWTMNADGSNPKMISDFASEPSFSPDGKQITFYAWEGTEGGNGLWIMNVDGEGREVKRNDANVRFTRWSPDNKYIAFWTGRVQAYSLKDTSVREVVDGEHPAWSPDGQRLVAKSCATGGGGCGLYTVGVDGSGKTPLTNNPEDGIPAWSPNGRKIAFICKPMGDTFDICIVNADGSGRQNLTSNNPEHDVNPAWLPDSSGIVFYSVREGKWGIYVMNVDGSGLQKIIDADAGPDWGRSQISITR